MTGRSPTGAARSSRGELGGVQRTAFSIQRSDHYGTTRRTMHILTKNRDQTSDE
jgi:hypothetical protein